MPKTKAQKMAFSALMALIMVYGMETYNHFLAGKTGLAAFALPVVELLWLMAAVIVLQEAIAGLLARFMAFRIVNPKTAPKMKVIVIIQFFTVCVMCPLMSFVATVAFKGDIAAPFAVKWARTLAVNFPFAMIYQLLIAGPVVRKAISFVHK